MDIWKIVATTIAFIYMFVSNNYILEIAVVLSLAIIISIFSAIYNYIKLRKEEKQKEVL